ncbi:TRAP transporter small permease [Salinispirillum marinum]|uniref:TRAP transporter small permease protein n=2 Tax=Saccharospirillaceae TaxID=255527 RepID=A0ABV8BDM8_9GAMM
MSALILRVHRYLLGVSVFGAGLAMAAVFVLVFLNAVGRYGLGRGITWASDMAVFMMIFGVMLGTAAAYLQERHVSFSVFTSLIPKRWQVWHVVLIDLVVFLVGVGLAYSGWEFIESRGRMRSASTGLRLWVFQSSMVLGGVLLALSGLIMAAKHRWTSDDKETPA